MERVEAMQTIRGRGVLPDRAHGSEGSQERYLTHVEDVAGETVRVVKIVRPRGFQDMHQKGTVSDRQLATADRFYEIYERAHSDGMKAIDYSKLRVDGASGDMVGEDGTFKAIKLLQRIERHVGRRGYEILVKIVVEGLSIPAVAELVAVRTGKNPMNMRYYTSARLIEALDDLDEMWNVMRGEGTASRSSGIVRGDVVVEMSIQLPEGVSVEDFERNSADLRKAVRDSLEKQKALRSAVAK